MPTCIHIDGSSLRNTRTNKSGKHWTLGWAVIVNNGESERYGATKVSQDVHASHEIVAFIEGVIYAKSCNIAPQDLTVYTDDQLIGNANFYMWEGNYNQCLRQKIISQCNAVLTALYSMELAPVVLDYLENARFHKLKGHTGLVYQERADYLAKASAYMHRGECPEGILSYDDWLNKGFVRYLAEDKVDIRYPAFVGH